MTAARTICAAIVVVATVAVGSLGLAAQPAAGEYEVKAAFLYNFARYIEWPEEAVPDAEDTFVIGVLGEDPFGPILDRIAKSKTVDGRKIAVRRFATVEDYTPCHILFVSSSETDRLATVLARLAESHVLVVGDTPGSARQGVIINFVIEQSKVRLEINPGAAERAGLKISSKLLRLATIVGDTRREED